MEMEVNNKNNFEFDVNERNFETPAFQILDVLGNTDPKYSEIKIAEKLLETFPQIHSFLTKIHKF